MAKRKEVTGNKKQVTRETHPRGGVAPAAHPGGGLGKLRPWLENKSRAARKILKPIAARANRWGATVLAIAFALGISAYFFWPKDEIRQLQERLVNNPNNFEAHLKLAEKFLENNQLKEAEKMLLLAQAISNQQLAINNSGSKVLGEKSSARLEELWQQKHLSDPEDIKRLIAGWEKILEEKPDYRDGYLQLAVLYYKLGENAKAKLNLAKALELDPNYEPAKELERILE